MPSFRTNAYNFLVRKPIQSILSFAILRDSVNLARFAIYVGADIHATSQNYPGSSLLVDCRSKQMAEFLYKRGTKPKTNNAGKTELEVLDDSYYFIEDVAIFLLSVTDNAPVTKLLTNSLSRISEGRYARQANFRSALVEKNADVFAPEVLTNIRALFNYVQYGYLYNTEFLVMLNSIYRNFQAPTTAPGHLNQSTDSLECYAAGTLNTEAAKKLINANNVNSSPGASSTPLWEAARADNLEVVTHILSLPNVSCAENFTHDNPGSTPQDVVALRKTPNTDAILKLLFNKFPDAKVWQSTAATYLGLPQTAQSRAKATLLQHAASICSQQQFAELLKGVTVKQANDQKLVFRALSSGNIDALKALISKGCDLDLLDEEKVPPLYFAATSNHANADEMVELLVKSGANPNLEIVQFQRDDLAGRNMLHHLASNRGFDLTAVKRLVSAGVNIDSQTTRLLLSSKQDAGNTPLHYATTNGLIQMVTALLDAGAKQLPNQEGKRPRDLITQDTPNFRSLIKAFDAADAKSRAAFLFSKYANKASEAATSIVKAAYGTPVATLSAMATVAFVADTALRAFKHKPQ